MQANNRPNEAINSSSPDNPHQGKQMYYQGNPMMSFFKLFGDPLFNHHNGSPMRLGSSFPGYVHMIEAPPPHSAEQAKETNLINKQSIKPDIDEDNGLPLPNIGDCCPSNSPKLFTPSPPQYQNSPIDTPGTPPEIYPSYLKYIEHSPVNPNCEISEIKFRDEIDHSNEVYIDIK